MINAGRCSLLCFCCSCEWLAAVAVCCAQFRNFIWMQRENASDKRHYSALYSTYSCVLKFFVHKFSRLSYNANTHTQSVKCTVRQSMWFHLQNYFLYATFRLIFPKENSNEEKRIANSQQLVMSLSVPVARLSWFKMQKKIVVWKRTETNAKCQVANELSKCTLILHSVCAKKIGIHEGDHAMLYSIHCYICGASTFKIFQLSVVIVSLAPLPSKVLANDS